VDAQSKGSWVQLRFNSKMLEMAGFFSSVFQHSLEPPYSCSVWVGQGWKPGAGVSIISVTMTIVGGGSSLRFRL
jgi:hypothetical protein